MENLGALPQTPEFIALVFLKANKSEQKRTVDRSLQCKTLSAAPVALQHNRTLRISKSLFKYSGF
jgi:hypothetical protein